MVSIQTNVSVLSGIQKSFFQTTGRAVSKQNKAASSVKSEPFEFRFHTGRETRQKLSDQNAILHFNQLTDQDKAGLFYKGTPISQLSSHEATALVQDDGYFGIDKTSQRIIDFVIKGAGNDIDRLRAGRQGVLQGFAEAEKAWGGALPEICCKTIEQTIKQLDDRIAELGGTARGIMA
ncbi:MAG: hydrogenase-4 component G [Proteobacteria bacterium]|nr:hydrogenase-4 component G [Desulfobacula sp.]MBU3953588.1 hydrogenase-4 component G [Pseudomonadota bacterium]MBU4130240.1 hydrogenase-4 component G [Pseudomonadota bacterium]